VHEQLISDHLSEVSSTGLIFDTSNAKQVTLTTKIHREVNMHKQPLLVIDGRYLICASKYECCIGNVMLQALGTNNGHGVCKLSARRLTPVLFRDLRDHEVLQQFTHG
jgi:hypothetical protein